MNTRDGFKIGLQSERQGALDQETQRGVSLSLQLLTSKVMSDRKTQMVKEKLTKQKCNVCVMCDVCTNGETICNIDDDEREEGRSDKKKLPQRRCVNDEESSLPLNQKVPLLFFS